MESDTVVRKGVILAVDIGAKMRPVTLAINKCLIPIYDKPMLFYPLSALLLAGVQQVLIVAAADAIPAIELTLGSGEQFGISIVYVPHPTTDSVIATLAKLRPFFDNTNVVIAESNCLPFGTHFELALLQAGINDRGATLFAKNMRNGRHACEVVLDRNGRAITLGATSAQNSSSLAVAELAIYDHCLSEAMDTMAATRSSEKPLSRIARWYLESGAIQVSVLDDSATWYQVDHFDDAMCASVYVEMLQAERGTLVGSPEEAAYRRGLLTAAQLLRLSERHPNSYGHQLRKIALRDMPLRYDP